MTCEEMQKKIADLKREQTAAWVALEAEIQTKRDELSALHGQQFDELVRVAARRGRSISIIRERGDLNCAHSKISTR
jgi:hypothetical protein